MTNSNNNTALGSNYTVEQINAASYRQLQDICRKYNLMVDRRKSAVVLRQYIIDNMVLAVTEEDVAGDVNIQQEIQDFGSDRGQQPATIEPYVMPNDEDDTLESNQSEYVMESNSSDEVLKSMSDREKQLSKKADEALGKYNVIPDKSSGSAKQSPSSNGYTVITDAPEMSVTEFAYHVDTNAPQMDVVEFYQVNSVWDFVQMITKGYNPQFLSPIHGVAFVLGVIGMSIPSPTTSIKSVRRLLAAIAIEYTPAIINAVIDPIYKEVVLR